MSCGEWRWKSWALVGLFLISLLVAISDGSDQTEAISKLPEPPRDAVRGKEVDGVSLGLWSEKASYSQGEIRNVWVIENVQSNSRMSMETDQAFHSKSHLTVFRGDRIAKDFPIGGVQDGIVGVGFAGGIFSYLEDLKPGNYVLVWKTERQISNRLEITIAP